MLARPTNWILLIVIFAVAGCGGGGGGGTAPAVAFSLLSGNLGLHDIDHVEVEFNDSGDGVAVWVSDSGFGRRLIFSTYTAATGTWSAESVLADFAGRPGADLGFRLAAGTSDLVVLYASDGQVYAATHSAGAFGAGQMLDDTGNDDLYIGGMALVSNGSGFAAVWTRGETRNPDTSSVRASTRPGGTGLWSLPSTLGATGEIGNLAVATNGTGYMALWTGDGDLFANYFSGGNWLGNAVLVDDRAEVIYQGAVASNGLGYQIAWVQGDGTAESVFTCGFDVAFVKSVNVTIDTTSTFVFDATIVSNGTDYLVAWLQDGPTDIVATTGSGVLWGPPQVLDEPTLPDSVSQEFHVATNGGGYAVMWLQDNAGGLPDVWARVYSGGWGPPQPVDAADGAISSSWTALTSNGNGYAAAWVQDDGGPGSLRSLWSNVHDGVNWRTAEVLEGASDSIQRVALVGRGADYAAAWAQQTAAGSAMLANVGEFDAGTGTWAPPANLAGVPRGGAVYPDRLLGNASGLTLAAWQQQQGRATVGFVAVQASDGIWGPAEVAGAHSIATNGAGFGVAWSEPNPATGRWEAKARIHDGRTWGATLPLGGLFTGGVQGVAIASNGTDYAVVWVQAPTPGANQNVYGSMFNGIGWSAPVQLDGAAATQSPNLASNGTGYAATWDAFNEAVVPVNVFDGANWSGQTTVSALSGQAFPSIRSNGTGYLIFWEEFDAGASGNSVFASISPTGAVGDFGAAEKVSTGLKPTYFPQPASDGTGYALAWVETDVFPGGFVHASVWDGANWSAPVRVGTGVQPESDPSIAGSSGGYGVAWKQQDTIAWRPRTLWAAIHSGSAWGAPVALETQDDPLDSFSEFYGGIASNGTTYAVAWSQQVNAAVGDGRHHVFLSTFNGASWTARQIENQAAESGGSLVAAVGARYSVLWSQPDPAGDPGVPFPWLYPGLE